MGIGRRMPPRNRESRVDDARPPTLRTSFPSNLQGLDPVLDKRSTIGSTLKCPWMSCSPNSIGDDEQQESTRPTQTTVFAPQPPAQLVPGHSHLGTGSCSQRLARYLQNCGYAVATGMRFLHDRATSAARNVRQPPTLTSTSLHAPKIPAYLARPAQRLPSHRHSHIYISN